MGDRDTSCSLEVLERLLAMGEVLNWLPRVARGVLACPTDEALGSAVEHAEAQDFLHLALLIARKGVMHWGGSCAPSSHCQNSRKRLTLN